jgi:Zn-dependent protease
MRGPYSDYAAPPVYIYPDRSKPKVRFSRTELIQLAVAILGLSGALTVLYIVWYRGLSYFPNRPGISVAFVFLTSFVSVASGVGLHEIMHKIVAQRYGLWAEFRYSLQGLAMAFIFSFFGFIFGAPGATYISGPVTKEQEGHISAAGPATNVVLGLAFLGLTAVTARWAYTSLAAGIVASIADQAAFLNLVLGGFNLIPILPLDGAKILRWNPGAWVVLLGAVIAIFVYALITGLLIL